MVLNAHTQDEVDKAVDHLQARGGKAVAMTCNLLNLVSLSDLHTIFGGGIAMPDTADELPVGEVGEILINGHVLLGPAIWGGWTGRAMSICVDRIKRMINTFGYRVWPAEVEAKLYHHPDIAGADVTGKDITVWAQTQMAVYKVPWVIRFVSASSTKTIKPANSDFEGRVIYRTLPETRLRPKGAA